MYAFTRGTTTTKVNFKQFCHYHHQIHLKRRHVIDDRRNVIVVVYIQCESTFSSGIIASWMFCTRKGAMWRSVDMFTNVLTLVCYQNVIVGDFHFVFWKVIPHHCYVGVFRLNATLAKNYQSGNNIAWSQKNSFVEVWLWSLAQILGIWLGLNEVIFWRQGWRSVTLDCGGFLEEMMSFQLI